MKCDSTCRADTNPPSQIDLVFCNGVFHHILPQGRGAVLDYVKSCLKPGGLFALWENNPWNPGTRYVMNRVSFDIGTQSFWDRSQDEIYSRQPDSKFSVPASYSYFPESLVGSAFWSQVCRAYPSADSISCWPANLVEFSNGLHSFGEYLLKHLSARVW